MIPEIKKLSYYCHIHLRSHLLTQKDETKIKETEKMLNTLYNICPAAKQTFQVIIKDLETNTELLLTRGGLIKILQKEHKKQMLKLSWGVVISKCITQTGDIK
ncbi:MAG: hypothetical protein R6V14_04030 [Halanaerobiales bacterium]